MDEVAKQVIDKVRLLFGCFMPAQILGHEEQSFYILSLRVYFSLNVMNRLNP